MQEVLMMNETPNKVIVNDQKGRQKRPVLLKKGGEIIFEST